MTILQGSRSGLAYVAETTFGVTPATPTLIPFPYTSHSLNLTKQRVQGTDLQPDRMLRVDRHGNRSADGDIVADMRRGDYDPFLESAFMNTWAVGSTLATTSATSAAGTTTIGFATQASAPFPVGATIVVAGVTPSGFNGTYTVTACTTTTVSFAGSTTGPQTVAGTVGLASVLKVGTTLKTFSIEDQANDTAATDAFRLFTGMGVSKLGVSIKPNNMVQSTFSFVGKDMTVATSSAGTNSTPAIYKPFDAYSGTIKIADAGGVLSSIALVTGIDFSIDNAFNPTYVVGSASTPQLEYGRATVEGTITAYFEDLALINRFLNETETAFEVQVDGPDASNGMTFLFPRIKINAADVPVAGPESRILSLPFVALYDTTENTNVKVTRYT